MTVRPTAGAWFLALIVASLVAVGCTGTDDAMKGVPGALTADPADPVVGTDPDWYLRADTLALEPSIADRLSLAAGGNAAAAARLGYDGLPAQEGPDAAAEGPRVPAPVAAGAWSGLESLGVWQSTSGPTWPTTGFDIRWRGQLHPVARDPDGEWMEIILSTIDESDDYLEPAYIYRESGITLGLDFMSSDGEVHWVAPRQLPDPHGVHTYRMTADAQDGQVEVWIDGQLWLSDHIEPEMYGHRQSAPFEIVAPAPGHPVFVGRSVVGLAWAQFGDLVGGGTLERFDASALGTWSPELSAGVSQPFTGPRIVKGESVGFVARSADLFDLGEFESATWMFRGQVFPVVSGHSECWIGQRRDGLTARAGWSLGSEPDNGVEYALTISDGDDEVAAAADELPLGDHITVAVLDRRAGELRLFIDGTQVGTGDATHLGAVDGGGAAYVFPGIGQGAMESAAVWQRALSAREIRQISRGR
jgi:hypothetical protein